MKNHLVIAIVRLAHNFWHEIQIMASSVAIAAFIVPTSKVPFLQFLQCASKSKD